MTMLVSALALLRHRLAALPKAAWLAIAAVLLLLGAWRWHDGRIAAAAQQAAMAQARADRARFDAASRAASQAQAALVARLATRQSQITKGTDDALRAATGDLARRYDDLRLRWAAARTDPGRAGDDHPAAVPGAAGGVDSAACAAAGWVDFDAAAASAQAADTAIAKDDAWIAWAAAQAVAWPH